MDALTNSPEGAISHIAGGDAIHYIIQTDTELIERDFDGEIGPGELVGSAKEGTAGTYVLLGENRAFYCLNDENILQDFEFLSDTGEWTPGQLSMAKVVAAPNTKVAGTYTNGGSIYIFYQDPSGQIQSVSNGAGSHWQPLIGLPSTTPVDGASIYAISMNDSIHVFYAHKDNSIHALILSGNKWSDAKEPLTDAGSAKSYIFAVVDDDGYSLEFRDAEKKLYILEDSKLTYMGWFTEEGKFRRPTDAEGSGRGPRRCRW